MALRAVLDHPKFADLKARLQQPRGSTLGWLEAMWHFAGRFTPQGNIGKYSDAAIEAWVEWDGEPGKLIAVLIETKWLDEDSTHRLLVHDWAHHADKATKTALGRAKLAFCSPTVHTPGEQVAQVCIPVTPVCTPPEPVPEPEPEPGAGSGETAPPACESFADPEAEERSIPDDLPDAPLGNFLLERLSIPHSFALAAKFASCVALIARDERLPRGRAATMLLERARDHPPDSGKWRFWLEDGSWKPREHAGISTEGWE